MRGFSIETKSLQVTLSEDCGTLAGTDWTIVDSPEGPLLDRVALYDGEFVFDLESHMQLGSALIVSFGWSALAALGLVISFAGLG